MRLVAQPARASSEVLEPEGLADVLPGGTEDFAVDIDQPSVSTMPQPPSDRPSDGIATGVADPLVQVEVAHGVRHDWRAEHLLFPLRDERAEIHVGIGER